MNQLRPRTDSSFPPISNGLAGGVVPAKKVHSVLSGEAWFVRSDTASESQSGVSEFLDRPWAHVSFAPKLTSRWAEALSQDKVNSSWSSSAPSGIELATPAFESQSAASTDSTQSALSAETLAGAYLHSVLRGFDAAEAERDTERLITAMRLYLLTDPDLSPSSQLAHVIRNFDDSRDEKAYLLADILARSGAAGRAHEAALQYLTYMLRMSSQGSRDAAALGLALLGDAHAIPYLRKAIRAEHNPLLVQTYDEVISRIR